MDLIIPTVLEGIAIHGTKNMFIESFKIEYGVTKNNMTFYNELNKSTMVNMFLNISIFSFHLRFEYVRNILIYK